MTEVLDAGVALIHWVEELRTPALNQFFLFFTDLGSTIGYLVMLPVLWWGFSWKLGARVFFALVVSIYLNTLIKDVIALPRPFLYAEVDNLRVPAGFSFPSGHAQQAALFWGLLALHFRKAAFTIVAVWVIFFIGISRIYLGVHFPSDVIAGWALGVAVASIYVRWSAPLAQWAVHLPLKVQVSLALIVPIALAVLHPSRNGAMAMGGLAGALGGLVFAHHRGLYPEGDQARSRRAWLIVGLIGLPVIYLGLRRLSPGTESAYYQLYLWARFAAIGLWVSFAVPRVVSHFRERRSEA